MRAMFVMLLCFVVSGCVGFAYDKSVVKSFYVEKESSLVDIETHSLSDKWVTIKITNTSDEPVTIDWNEAQIAGKPVYVGALVSQIETGGRNVAPSFLPPKKSVMKTLFPAENVSEISNQSGFFSVNSSGSASGIGNESVMKHVYTLEYPTYILIHIKQGSLSEYAIINVDADFETITDCNGKDKQGRYHEDRRYEIEKIIYENGGYLPDGSMVKNLRTIHSKKQCN